MKGLGVSIEDLDFAARRCSVKAKGAHSKARRRGQAREDCMLEMSWAADHGQGPRPAR
nr:hypothetical protein [Streptomyces sp. UH6]